jgi:predicted Fe-Mo cluster-binding NifX family protein
MRIVVPINEDKGVDSRLSEHFGRAPFFAVFELDKDGQIMYQKFVQNESEHFGGTGFPPDRILQLKPDVVITFGMGPRALSQFQEAKVAVLRANSDTVNSIISSYIKDELEELTEGCHHAQHRY